jgi:LysR family transcriptional regulator, glycine cleavage system transcriptional activator
MPRRLPPLNALRAFEAAARHESFAGAAAELHVDHAAISRHVRALESRLGVTLFRRATRGVELTPAGRQYLQAVSAAFDGIAEATDALAKPKHVQIRLSVEPAFAGKWLIHRLGRFHAEHPDLDIVLDATVRLVDLARDEADLAIRYGQGGWPGLRHDLIAALRLYPVGRPELRGRRRAALQPDELRAFVLLHEDDGQLWRRWFAAAGVPEVNVSRGPRILESALAIDAAITGQGIALADEVLVADDLAAGRLTKLCDVALRDNAYYLVSLTSALRRRPIAAFRDWLLAESAALRQSR